MDPSIYYREYQFYYCECSSVNDQARGTYATYVITVKLKSLLYMESGKVYM